MKTKLVLIVVMSFLSMGSFFDGFACHTTINGIVTDQYSNILSSATITIEIKDLLAYSDNSGFYNLNKISRGKHTVKAKKKGFVEKTKEIDAPFFGATIEENFVLDEVIYSDEYEPNNSTTTAKNITSWAWGRSNSNSELSNEECWFAQTQGIINSGSDEDWYKIEFSTQSIFYVKLYNISDGNNYDLKLYSEWVGTWTTCNNPSNQAEFILNWNSGSYLIYYLKVYSADNSCDAVEYKLDIEKIN